MTRIKTYYSHISHATLWACLPYFKYECYVWACLLHFKYDCHNVCHILSMIAILWACMPHFKQNCDTAVRFLRPNKVFRVHLFECTFVWMHICLNVHSNEHRLKQMYIHKCTFAESRFKRAHSRMCVSFWTYFLQMYIRKCTFVSNVFFWIYFQ